MRSSRFVRRIARCCPLLMAGAGSLLLATTGCANSLARGTGGAGNPALSDAALFRLVVLAEREERRRSGLLDPLSVDTLPWTDTDDQGRPTEEGLRRIPRDVARHRRAVLDSLAADSLGGQGWIRSPLARCPSPPVCSYLVPGGNMRQERAIWFAGAWRDGSLNGARIRLLARALV
jgi:hypothetical protein